MRRATKFIVGDNSLDYKERLLNCNLLPLMMEYEIRDILFFNKCVKTNDLPFNIHEFITFNTTTTRSATFFKLLHSRPRNRIQSNEYFNRFPRLWNSLPFIDIELSIFTLKDKLKTFFWQHFIINFNPNNPCTFHFLCPCSKCCLNILWSHVLVVFYNHKFSVKGCWLCLQSFSASCSPIATHLSHFLHLCTVKHNNNIIVV